MYQNDLVYGKDKTERIVSLEVDNDELVIFQEMQDGTILESRKPATFWVITNRKASEKQAVLEGNQYFKYLAEFANFEEYNDLCKKLYQKRMDFYRIYDPVEAMMVKDGYTFFKGMKPKEVSILSWDIESDGLKKTRNSEIYIISNTYRSATGEVLKHSFYLDDYDSQADMLEDWCEFVREMNPSILVGHNIFGYDWEYMDHVANINKVSLNIGRNGSALRFNNRTSQFRKDGSQSLEYRKAYVYGRIIVDTMFLSYKYDIARAFPSYALKVIIKHLGMEKQGRTFVDASMIKKYYYDRKKYPGMWEKAKAYADEDSDDALALYDLMIPGFFYLATSVAKTFQEINTGATGAQINSMMVRAYLQEGHSIAKATEVYKYQGAYSFGIPGIYSNCLKVDVASLYPSIMRQYKVYDKKKDPKAYFLKLVDTFTLQRLKHKKIAAETQDKYYNDMQEGEKIFINSAYGALGASGLNYNSIENAEFVTRKGREVLDTACQFATGQSVEYWFNKSKNGDSEDETEAA